MTQASLVAVVCAGVAGAVLVGPGPVPSLKQRLPTAWSLRQRLRPPRLVSRVVAGCAAGLVTLTAVAAQQLQALAIGLSATALAIGLSALRQRGIARNAAATRRAAVLETCDLLAADLRAGQPAPRALRYAADAWPELQPAATAAELGGDVPSSLRAVGQRPGAESLAAVAAAWEIAQRSGAGLAGVLDRTGVGLREADATRREVAAALAAPRATARLLALLPGVGLLLGSGVGANPWQFLFTTSFGAGCLAVGCLLALTGLAWVERLADTAERTA